MAKKRRDHKGRFLPDGGRGKPLAPPSWQGPFLAAFARTGNVTLSANAAQISVDSVYLTRKRDPEFRRRMELARLEAGDLLEAAAYRRAVQGVERPLVQGGKMVFETVAEKGEDGQITYRETGKPIMIREYSDHLLARLLEANLPHKFRANWQGEASLASGTEQERRQLQLESMKKNLLSIQSRRGGSKNARGRGSGLVGRRGAGDLREGPAPGD